ncbi:SPOR domain-containing protein [Clostridium sp. YIM B02551]|uniref:SPOR domain-containing protein n=1 Tax=Clostridium sp. YIM B02551 TaxID=2910679 RepID=UPI001EEB325F|nr:hypothetical protein [Clostridium sp. YIM B02551]
MRYTRYNYKKKSNKGARSFGYVITIVIIALVIGTAIANAIFGGGFSFPKGFNLIKKSSSANASNGDAKSYKNFEIVQCGYYSKEENAIDIQNKIKDQVPVYVVKDDSKFRVIAGIYQVGKGDEVKNKLDGLGVNAIKLKININGSDYYDSLIGGIVDGYLKMINSINDSSVKSVNTDEFKKWASAFEEKGDKAKEIKDIKTHIASLPNDFTKDKIQGEMGFLDKLIEPYKSN